MAVELHVDASAGEPHRSSAILAACRALLPGWGGLPPHEGDVAFVAGGISNALFKVTPPASRRLAAVAFRVYGLNTERFVDRGRELALLEALHPLAPGAVPQPGVKHAAYR